jgi:hypothetical protein
VKDKSNLFKRLGVLTLLILLLATNVVMSAAQRRPRGEPEVNVRTGFTNVPDNTGSVTFNETIVGISTSKDFVIENSGRVNLTIGSVTVPAGFVLELITNTTIVPNGIGRITVRCPGTTAGTFSGTFSFTNNDTDENPYNFTISCTVRQPGAPDMAVFNEADLSLIPDNTGSITMTGVQGQRPELEISVHSEGEGILTFSAPTVPAGFEVFQQTDSIFFIVCIGATTGTFSGEVSFDNNDPDENPYNFHISCTIN